MQIFAAFSIFVSGCIFDNQKQTPLLTMQYTGTQGDTLSPMPTISFAFSAPIDSSVDFAFFPPVSQLYTVTYSNTCDTIHIAFCEMLSGNTRYAVKLASSVLSRSGSTVDAGSSDSAVFFTAACEQEPNNSIALADTIRPPSIYGTLPTASDTDVYCAVSSRCKSFFVTSACTNDTFTILDSALSPVNVSYSNDTATVPDSVRYPLYIFVFATVNGCGGIYKLGVIAR